LPQAAAPDTAITLPGNVVEVFDAGCADECKGA
jgi:hypothetical protein